uniref:Uncharacterized protein n=1 Tax=Acrobeloides nanus TaxID=290746 RepID=A0A914E2U3_9BILA
MNRTTLRVVFARNPPDIYDNCLKFPTLYPSFRCPYPGRTAEILGILAEYLNWDIQPIFMDSAEGMTNFGSFNNELGEWSGALGYLYRNEADTICLTYEYLKHNDVYFDYSYPIWNV